jgi:hypothetical protein
MDIGVGIKYLYIGRISWNANKRINADRAKNRASGYAKR